MDTNPFQSPQSSGAPDPLPPGVDPRYAGRARQVPIVAALMSVHGIFLCIAGIIYLGFTLFLNSQFFDQLQQQDESDAAVQAIPTLFSWLYAGIGAAMLAAGVLGIVAGIRNYSFRSRTLGIVALAGGMALCITCWCSPFSLGLLIYGLIIYLSPEATRAFAWQQARSDGNTA